MTTIHPGAPPLSPFSEGAGTGDPSPFHPKIRPAVADAQPAKIAQGSIASSAPNETEVSD